MTTASSTPGLAIRGVTLNYRPDPIFESLDLDVAAGITTVLLGASGVGKTSLLRIIAGLASPSAGTVQATDGGALAARIAYMAQQDLLYPWLTVQKNVTLGAALRGERPDRVRASRLLEQVGLAGAEAALPAQLSGGMRQRVALARTLYENRPIVLMDEPFSALDTVTRMRIQGLAAELLHGRTVLLITHDPLEACRIGHHLHVLSGAPARLGCPLSIGGAIPRAADDPDMLHIQAQLMRDLLGDRPE